MEVLPLQSYHLFRLIYPSANRVYSYESTKQYYHQIKIQLRILAYYFRNVSNVIGTRSLTDSKNPFSSFAEIESNSRSIISVLNLSLAILQYSSEQSIPIYFLLSDFAATQVVPLPLKGSTTIPSGGQKQSIRSYGIIFGKVAGCLCFNLLPSPHVT